MNILIIDDNEPIRSGLKKQLASLRPEVQVAEANTVKTGLQAIENNNPDILFLDVEMSDGTGMDLLMQLGEHQFQLIFVTAYNHYAVEAFRFSAIDFLLKPITMDELAPALEKAEKQMQHHQFQMQLKILNEHLMGLRQQEKKIVLKDQENVHFVKVGQIIRCESDGPYTHFFLEDGNELIISKNLKGYEKLLAGYGFFRSHHSHLINIHKIQKFCKTDGGYLIMEDQAMVPVSTRKKEALLRRLEEM
ncbi:MAG: LytR/AlgR family response regulator transcription factor [Flammeovirgaceae bacterium]